MMAGDRVVIHALWSSFVGMRGRVIRAGDPMYVLIDGDRLPVCVHPLECIPEEAATLPMTAGE